MAVNIGNLVAGESEIELSYISIPALKGDKGDTGRGISSVIKTSTVGLVDTWTITYTDGSTSSFDVTNGADGDDYVITEADYEEIADIVLDNIEIPTKTSDLTNDSGFIDKNVNNLTNYYKTSETYNKTQTDTLLNGKQDTLESGTNIKTINNQSILGSGNITIQGGGGTSDYTDLTNKPSINNVTLSGNKTTSDLGLGTYSKPSGGIPKTDLASDVQTSLGKADTAIQEHQDITGKEDKTNKVTTVDENSTNTQYPSAKLFYDTTTDLQTENERLKATLPTTTGEGQEVTLEKTAELDFVKPPLPRGNSEQEGEPSPDNEVPITNVTGNVEVTISNENNTESKTLPVSLGNIELCKIGNYQDYLYKNNGKWYVHKNTIKIDLSTITSYTHTSGWRNPTAFVADGVFNHGYSGYTTVASLFCNRLIADTPARVTGSVINAIGLGRNSSIYISVEGITTSNALITYFSQNPTYLYAPLATPTNTEITNTTLINQLEEISKTLSYQGQTNITSDTIALFDVEAYQDLKIMTTTSISSSSTDNEYPSAKAVYDYIQSLNGDEVSY